MTDNDEVNLIDYLNVIIKRKLLIAGVVILSVLGAFVYSLTLPNLFEGVTTILILPKSTVAVESETKLKTTDSEVNINTYIEFFFNRRVAMSVIEKLGLDKIDDSVGAGYILGKGEIEKVPGTDLLKLVVRDADPILARDISNQWAKEFIKYMETMYSSDKDEINAIMEKKYISTADRMKEIERKLTKISEKRDPILEQKIQLIQENIIALTKRNNVLGNANWNYKSRLQSELLTEAESILFQMKKEILRTTLKIEENEINIDELGKNSDVTPRFSKKNMIDIPFGEKVSTKSGTFSVESFEDPVVVRARLEKSSLNLENRGLVLRGKKLKKLIPLFKEDILKVIPDLSLEQQTDSELADFLKKTKEKMVQFSGTVTIEKMFQKLNNIHNFLDNKILESEIAERLVGENVKLINMVKGDKEYQIESKRLEFEYENIKNSYTTLGKKIAENILLDAVVSKTVKITEPAIEPRSPAWPNRRRIILIAFAVSFFCSIFLAFFIEFLQNANKENLLQKKEN